MLGKKSICISEVHGGIMVDGGLDKNLRLTLLEDIESKIGSVLVD